MASSWDDAEKIKDRLAQDGLLVMLRACGSCGGRISKNVELLVPEIEVREAQDIIMEFVGVVKA